MKKLMAFCACVVVFSGLSVAPVLATGSAETVSYGAAGPPILEYFEGRVTVNGDDAVLGQKIAPGSVVQAGADSICEIGVGSNVLRIYENSIAVLNIDAQQSRLDLKTGALGAVLDKVQAISSGGAFAVATPTVVAGVRGTVFYVKVEDPANTYVCTCNGTLHLAESGNDREIPVSAAHHAALRYTRGGSGSIERATADMIYHTDAEMEDIAKIIESTIDWSTQ